MKETSNLLDTEFNTPVIKMLNEPKGRIDYLGENVYKETISIKKDTDTIRTHWKIRI